MKGEVSKQKIDHEPAIWTLSENFEECGCSCQPSFIFFIEKGAGRKRNQEVLSHSASCLPSINPTPSVILASQFWRCCSRIFANFTGARINFCGSPCRIEGAVGGSLTNANVVGFNTRSASRS